MAQREAIKEINAVVGYLPDAVAKALSTKGQHAESVEVKLDRGKENEMLVRIKAGDCAGVLLGASQNGETAVQVFLKDGASIETFTRSLASDFLRPIRDLTFIKFRPPINSIYVRPQFIDKIVQFNREDVP